MNLLNSNSTSYQPVEVNLGERWSIYHRLRELQIPCSCAISQPLRVEVGSPLSAIQLWSVVQSVTKNRDELVCWLNQCWESKMDKYK